MPCVGQPRFCQSRAGAVCLDGPPREARQSADAPHYAALPVAAAHSFTLWLGTKKLCKRGRYVRHTRAVLYLRLRRMSGRCRSAPLPSCSASRKHLQTRQLDLHKKHPQHAFPHLRVLGHCTHCNRLPARQRARRCSQSAEAWCGGVSCMDAQAGGLHDVRRVATFNAKLATKVFGYPAHDANGKH